MSDPAADTASKRAEANRRNAQKSTGPRTPEGKDRSRFNAIRHGLRAKSDILPGEDAGAFQTRLDGWTRELNPRDEVERFLVGHAVRMSWQLDRAQRAIDAAMADAQIAASDRVTKQADDVLALGLRLLHSCLSISPYPGDTEDPMRLVNRLESCVIGCAWLLDRWDDLRRTLEDGGTWQRDDRIRAIRLLGHRPINLVDDDRVLLVYVYCIAMDPVQPSELTAIAESMDASSKAQFLMRVKERKLLIPYPEDATAARASLLELIAEEERRLEELMNTHRALEEAAMAGSVIDASLEGERVRRYQIACDRALIRVLNVLGKRRVQIEEAGDSQSSFPHDDPGRAGDVSPLSVGQARAESQEVEAPHSPFGIDAPCPVASTEMADHPVVEPVVQALPTLTEVDTPRIATNEPNAEASTAATNEPNSSEDRPEEIPAGLERPSWWSPPRSVEENPTTCGTPRLDFDMEATTRPTLYCRDSTCPLDP